MMELLLPPVRLLFFDHLSFDITAARNISNLRYVDNTTLTAENEEKLRSPKEESEEAGLKLKIQKTKIMASGPITSWGNRWGDSGNSDRLYFLGLQNHCGR